MTFASMRLRHASLRGEWLRAPLAEIVETMRAVGLTPMDGAPKVRKPGTPATRQWLLDFLNMCPDMTVTALGEFYGIGNPTRETIADFRAEQIASGDISPYEEIVL